MQNYFNRIDREYHIIMMVFHSVVAEWLEKNRSLNKEERRYIKTALTWLKKGYDSMIVRSKTDYIKALRNTARHSELFLEDKSGRIKREEDEETRTVSVEDIYDLAEFAVVECSRCKVKDDEFEGCSRYKLFMRMAIPPVSEETDICPYK